MPFSWPLHIPAFHDPKLQWRRSCLDWQLSGCLGKRLRCRSQSRLRNLPARKWRQWPFRIREPKRKPKQDIKHFRTATRQLLFQVQAWFFSDTNQALSSFGGKREPTFYRNLDLILIPKWVNGWKLKGEIRASAPKVSATNAVKSLLDCV